eukprot:scaffold9359_cov49-Cyclotella_meneghiniana.AAC.2
MVAIASVGVVVNVTLAVVLGENHIHLPGDNHGWGARSFAWARSPSSRSREILRCEHLLN